MPFFNVGDKVYKKENPNKIYTIKKRTDITHCIPNYILIDESWRYGMDYLEERKE